MSFQRPGLEFIRLSKQGVYGHFAIPNAARMFYDVSIVFKLERICP